MKINYLLIITLLIAGLLIAPVSAAAGDKILFEQVNISSNVTQIWNNGTFQVRPVVQGVTTTDGIDNSALIYSGSNGFGDSSDVEYAQASNFTASKSQFTGITVYPNSTVGSPLSSVVFELRTTNTSDGLPSAVVVSSAMITNTTWTSSGASGTPITISAPAILSAGQRYWMVFRTESPEPTNSRYRIDLDASFTLARAQSVDGGTTWGSINGQFKYLEHYAKNTEAVNATVNGNTISLDTADATGLLSGATVDSYNRVFEYSNGFNSSAGKFSDVFTATAGGYSINPMVIKGWGWTNTGESIQSASDTSARSVTFKINTALPVMGINVTATGFNNNVNTGLVELSGDNTTYTTIWDLPTSASPQTNTASSGYVNGNKTFYIRLSKDTTNGYIRWDDLKITALLNTSTIDTPELFYQTGTNTVNLTSYGNAVSSSLDPSLKANVSLIEGTGSNSITADFTISNSSGIEPLLTHFTDTSTTNEATIDAWLWDFGDGSTSTDQNPPDHTYQNGTYDVNLTITNTSLSLVSTKIQTVTVYKLPNADFSSFNTQGTAPFTTYLYDTSTNLNPGPYTHYWDLGDGNTSTSQNLYYTWNITGTYEVKHSVSDSITTAWKNVTGYVTVGTPTPPVVAPVASFYGGPQTGNVPLTVSFTDVSSNIPTSWFWDFGDGTNSTLQNPSHAYTRSGFKNVALTATNSAGSNITVRSKFVRVS